MLKFGVEFCLSTLCGLVATPRPLPKLSPTTLIIMCKYVLWVCCIPNQQTLRAGEGVYRGPEDLEARVRLKKNVHVYILQSNKIILCNFIVSHFFYMYIMIIHYCGFELNLVQCVCFCLLFILKLLIFAFCNSDKFYYNFYFMFVFQNLTLLYGFFLILLKHFFLKFQICSLVLVFVVALRFT